MSFYKSYFNAANFYTMLFYHTILVFVLRSFPRYGWIFLRSFLFPNLDPALKPENTYSCILKVIGSWSFRDSKKFSSNFKANFK